MTTSDDINLSYAHRWSLIGQLKTTYIRPWVSWIEKYTGLNSLTYGGHMKSLSKVVVKWGLVIFYNPLAALLYGAMILIFVNKGLKPSKINKNKNRFVLKVMMDLKSAFINLKIGFLSFSPPSFQKNISLLLTLLKMR